MRNRFILSILLLVIASGLAWAQFWKGFSDTDRRRIAEAYWLAGSQYQAVGESQKGTEYREMARNIYPSLDPSSIADQELPSAAELLAQGRAAVIGGGASTRTAATSAAAAALVTDTGSVITEAFDAWMGGILSKDTDVAMAGVSGNIRFLRLRQTVTKAELETSLLGYFDKADFPSALVTDSVQTSSIFVEPAQSPVDGVGGPVYVLNARARADLSESIPFWGEYMQYYYHQENGSWVVFAIF